MSVLSTNDYLPGALVINKCLKLTKAQYPFTLLITPNISDSSISILKKNNIQIKKIDGVFLKNHKIDKWYFTFSKLNIFSQTQFEKIVYIDLDMVITENLDHLFNKKHYSSVNSGGFIYKDWIDLNSGLIVFMPSKELFNSLINMTKDGTYYSSDQDILQKYYKDWSTNKELNLGYQYNMFVCHIPQAIQKLNFTTIHNMSEINAEPKQINNIKVFHYIHPKPWKKVNILNKYIALWHEIYDSIEVR
tara:strand:- start:554 stop:1294 length:741 start_codon:yes stop_codon:yes gene_type:complete